MNKFKLFLKAIFIIGVLSSLILIYLCLIKTNDKFEDSIHEEMSKTVTQTEKSRADVETFLQSETGNSI